MLDNVWASNLIIKICYFLMQPVSIQQLLGDRRTPQVKVRCLHLHLRAFPCPQKLLWGRKISSSIYNHCVARPEVTGKNLDNTKQHWTMESFCPFEMVTQPYWYFLNLVSFFVSVDKLHAHLHLNGVKLQHLANTVEGSNVGVASPHRLGNMRNQCCQRRILTDSFCAA